MFMKRSIDRRLGMNRNRMKLFSFSYAGGSSTTFYKWRKWIDESIELIAVELPGRGMRLAEPLLDNMNDVVHDVFSAIKDQLTGDYAFFGHSMGGLIAYELCLKMKQEQYEDPIHLFISGRNGPQFPIPQKSDLSDKAFINEIVKYNGISKEVFNNKDYADLFIPILRSDFRVIESYTFQTTTMLNCDISVFYGKEDVITGLNELMLWKEVTSGTCSLYPFPGSHFFIDEHTAQVVEQINRLLTKSM